MLAGCSTYQKRWEAAKTADAAHAGAYEGQWASNRMSTAGGKLWCILKPAGPGLYRADFKATWHGVFKSEHSALLRAGKSRKPGCVNFHGEAAITAIVGSGKYTCKGELSPGAMTATYNASLDAGIFTLLRVALPK